MSDRANNNRLLYEDEELDIKDTPYKRHKKTILYYLKNYNVINAAEMQRQQDILEGKNYALELTGVSGGTTSDTTAQKALKLLEANDKDMQWMHSIDIVFKHYPYEWHVKSVMENFGIGNIKEKEASYLHSMNMFAKSSYYKYQKNVITAIATTYERMYVKKCRVNVE